MLCKLVTDKNWLKTLYKKDRIPVKVLSAEALLNKISYKNESYLARVQLDHNAHIERTAATNVRGEQLYHHKYQKQSKEWDTTPLKDRKGINTSVMATIFEQQKQSTIPLK